MQAAIAQPTAPRTTQSAVQAMGVFVNEDIYQDRDPYGVQETTVARFKSLARFKSSNAPIPDMPGRY